MIKTNKHTHNEGISITPKLLLKKEYLGLKKKKKLGTRLFNFPTDVTEPLLSDSTESYKKQCFKERPMFYGCRHFTEDSSIKHLLLAVWKSVNSTGL